MTSVDSEHWSTVRKPCCAQHRGSPFLCTGREQIYDSEPVGGVRPKFPTIDDSRSFRTTMDGSVTLLCPAQGFPVPLYKGFPVPQFEPVGSVRPKFPAMSNINGFMTYQGGTMTLLCAAQGFPVPSHRYTGYSFNRSFEFVIIVISYYYYYDYYYSEPVGGVRPKFPTIDDTRGFRTIKDGSVTLACSAQGFPVPVHKTSRKYKAQIPDDREFAYLYNVYGLSQQITGSTMSSSSLSRSSLQTFKVSLGGAMTLLCPAQGFPVPLHSTRPQLSGSSDLQRFSVSSLKSVTLLCPAQGYPVPLYRISELSSLIKGGIPIPACHRKISKNLVESTFLEPASSTKPRFPSVNDVGLRVTKDTSFTLLCPAQAYPVATYRRILYRCLKPVTSVKPKFTNADIKVVKPTPSMSKVSMTCPAQGFPVPITRTDVERETKITGQSESRIRRNEIRRCGEPRVPFARLPCSNYEVRQLLTVDSIIHNQLEAKHLPFLEKPRSLCYHDESGQKLASPAMPKVTLSPLLEPVGSKAPAFAGDTKLSLLIRRVNLDIGLLCNVQGHPPPKARY
ncbi:hypothetical protein M0802_004240 [Mischocyttarus mexicanus]|nr:hypothetical protein M0802_004240 [Mischocyttarus mexicanus]